MAKIYKAPKGFKPPDMRKYTGDLKRPGSIDKYFKDCEAYVDRLKQTIKESYGSVCPEAGEEIRFLVGDGYARYVVARLKPVELIWVDVGDRWHFEYVHRLTAADIRKQIKSERALNKLFSEPMPLRY